MRSSKDEVSPELRFWTILTVAHAAATIVVSLSAALWWINDYEETFMRGAKVIEPPLLRLLNILTTGLQLPLFPLIYSEKSLTKGFPVFFALCLNSAVTALIALIIWVNLKKLTAHYFR